MKPIVAGLIVFVFMLSVIAALYWYLAMSYKTTVTTDINGNNLTVNTGTTSAVYVVLIPVLNPFNITYSGPLTTGTARFVGLKNDTYTCLVLSLDMQKVLGTTNVEVYVAPQAPVQAPAGTPASPPTPYVPPVPVKAPGPA